MSVLTEAMTEAYAANSANYRIYETMELNHVTFDEPIRVIVGVDEDMMLPLTPGGTPVLFKATAFRIILPGSTEDGPTQARAEIDNVSGELNQYLEDAVATDQPVTAIYRGYTTADLTRPGDTITGLELWDVDLSPMTATGTLRFKELELQAFPLPIYDEEYYEALQDG